MFQAKWDGERAYNQESTAKISLKTCDLHQAREIMQTLPGGKVGRKTCTPFPNAGKHASAWSMLVEILIHPDWSIKPAVIDNWEGTLHEFFQPIVELVKQK